MFTGREDEIKEISNLITDDSTRLVNIWGSPGFGKTSVAIEVAHHLSSFGYPVYFFKLQGITTTGKILSKILSIFKSNLVDVNLTTVDKLISIFREISSPIIVILDNLDDLLSSETSAAELETLIVDFLDSNSNITVIFTTRELLENLRDQIKGFQDVRIRPFRSISSVKFVRQLLPSFSENVVAEVAETSFHIPLAIRLVASLIKNSSEEMANKALKELQFPENRFEHVEKNMQKLFDKPFEQLSSADKRALISLTVFTSATISKDAAIAVVLGEKRILSNAIRSLDTLVKKALIDVDLDSKYYSIHPLIHSFILVKAKDNDFENVLNSSSIRFRSYYLLLFERLNDDFLAGKSVDNPELGDVMENLSAIMHQSLINDSENAHHVFRILSKAEIFLFLVRIPSDISHDVFKLYEIAIQKSMGDSNDFTYLKLYVSSYFRHIAFSLFVSPDKLELPEDSREKMDQLSDGTTSKLSCYEGILNIRNGNVQDGIKQIEMSLGSLQSCPDHLLLKCLCLQILTVYCNNRNELEKSCEFRKMAVEVSIEIGNCNLFVVAECDLSLSNSQQTDVGEPLALFSYLLTKWSGKFWGEETKRHVCNFVSNLLQRLEMEVCVLYYSHQILCYLDFLLALLSIATGQETLFDEKIEFLNRSMEDCSSLSDNLFQNMSQKTAISVLLSGRLFMCYNLKGKLTNSKVLSGEARHKALDLSLQQNGERHKSTARCYFNIGCAELAVNNYSSALDSFDKALDIASSLKCEREDFDFISDIYFQKGMTHRRSGNVELSVSFFIKALDIKRKTEIDQESEKMADMLYILGLSQLISMDFTSGLATLKRSLQILKRLLCEKRLLVSDIVVNYLDIGKVFYVFENHDEAKKCFEEALEILDNTECQEDYLLDKYDIYWHFIKFKIDENSYVELLDRSLQSSHLIKEDKKAFLPMFYLTVGVKQLESGKYESGVASLQAALDIDLDVSLRAEPEIRECTAFSYLEMLSTLIKIGKSKLSSKVIERALRIAESLPEHMRPRWLFRLLYWKGRSHYEMKEYDFAIKCLKHALHKFAKQANDKFKELQCQKIITSAYYREGRYRDALASTYEALVIIKDIIPGGSKAEAESFRVVASIARKLQNRSLIVCNLRLAYKMYSKVLGQNHPETEASYLEYVQALMN